MHLFILSLELGYQIVFLSYFFNPSKIYIHECHKRLESGGGGGEGVALRKTFPLLQWGLGGGGKSNLLTMQKFDAGSKSKFASLQDTIQRI